MAYWWVSQNKTYYQEKSEGFLWAPKKSKNGRSIYHWETMREIRSGDIIFSYFHQQIVALSIALGVAYDASNPFQNSEKFWIKEGRRIDVLYKELDKPIILDNIVTDLQKILLKQDNYYSYSPLNRNGSGKQGYLFPLPDEAGEFLLLQIKRLKEF